ncbi:hypothetical protein JR316_0006466 [Psilocybe cubensis]|uniref:TEA domain-containing protein n=2 Tax=Psilocybe cubensis TaxID=181762 RepID=A0A8H7XKQ4_PSICU|nr:hypothetical protein JR316_0006466 [Psilocybe cubensis]KAH9481936.1 hypothetical protein JR316_0006466 [Psilocybe cubensis]
MDNFDNLRAPLYTGTTDILGSQSERTGRRSHKMMSVARRKEPVWPPALEEALLEALRLYRPVSKSGRPLRRFTKRNCFISRHILKKTGKNRTPKQVGSRLQQISESSPDAELKRLITSREFHRDTHSPQLNAPSSHPSPLLVANPSEYTASTASDIGSPEAVVMSTHYEPSREIRRLDRTPSSPHSYPPTDYSEDSVACYNSTSPSDSVSLLVELISANIGNRASAQLGLDADISDHGVDFILSLVNNENSGNISSFYNARKLSNIPPQILGSQAPQITILSQFLSPEVAYLCTFRVYMDNSAQVHTENTPLLASVAPAEHPSESHVWRAQLLPEYWERLSSSPALSRYTIMLEISELSTINRPDYPHGMPSRPKFSVAFNFKPSSRDDSPTTFYPNTTYDEPALSSVFPHSTVPLPINGGLSASSSISNISSQEPDSTRTYTWFDPSGAYLPYPLFGDGTANLGNNDQDMSSPYDFPQF